MKLYIIRHGETAWNKIKRFQGHTDIELNEVGVELAKKTGEGMKNIKIDYAFSSPLKRAYDTCRYALGERNIEIIKDERIKEIGFGEWEGERAAESNVVPSDFLEKFFGDPFNCVTPPGGESFEDVIKRTKNFYEELKANKIYKDASILISSHGAASRCLQENFFEDKHDLWRGGVPANCSVTIVDVDIENNTTKVEELDKKFYII